jgi:hypothetical protein
LGRAVGFPPVGRNETRGPFRLAFVLFFSFFLFLFPLIFFYIFSNPNMDSNFNSNLVIRQLLHSIFVQLREVSFEDIYLRYTIYIFFISLLFSYFQILLSI